MGISKKTNRKIALAFACIILVLYLVVIASAIWGSAEMTITLFTANTIFVVIAYFFSKNIRTKMLKDEDADNSSNGEE